MLFYPNTGLNQHSWQGGKYEGRTEKACVRNFRIIETYLLLGLCKQVVIDFNLSKLYY